METMKRKWGKPVTEVQKFVPQEFCFVCYTLDVVEVPFIESNGLVGLQIDGTNNHWHGTPNASYPADTEERNWRKVTVRCDPPAYNISYSEITAAYNNPPVEGDPLRKWEAYYAHGNGISTGIWVFHQIEEDGGNTYYRLHYTPDTVPSSHTS